MSPSESHPGASDAVLACSLSIGDRAERERWLKRLRRQSLGASSTADGVTVRFAASDPLEADVRALAAAEGNCCPFLSFEVERRADAIELVISGPGDARPIIDAMFSDER
jgi:hypothetical protein